MSAGALKPRWGQPLTGIICTISFFIIAWATWYVFGDPRGPIGWFPQPFVMILAMMILVGVWMHMLFGNWPFQKMPQPLQGVVMTVVNALLTWFVIEVFFYRFLGAGINFVNFYSFGPNARAAVVGFILMAFFCYPAATILMGKWPIAATTPQPAKGLAEFCFGTVLTMLFYAVCVAPFFTAISGIPNIAPAWWSNLAGTGHLHWTFGWYEWCIVYLFLTATVWRGKPWSAMPVAQPYRGWLAFVIIILASYVTALLCNSVISPALLPQEAFDFARAAGGDANVNRMLWHHSAEIAGFTLFPFLVWHNFFDDKVPGADIDSWGAMAIRTIGVFVATAVGYILYYHVKFGGWALGNPHMMRDVGYTAKEGAVPYTAADVIGDFWVNGESLLWNFWFIIPLLWFAWYFNKWPFYVEDK